jgi:hypothetical protein
MAKLKREDLAAITINCPKIGPTNIEIKYWNINYPTNLDWYADVDGPYGKITLTVTCPCGEWHEMEVYSW